MSLLQQMLKRKDCPWCGRIRTDKPCHAHEWQVGRLEHWDTINAWNWHATVRYTCSCTVSVHGSGMVFFAYVQTELRCAILECWCVFPPSYPQIPEDSCTSTTTKKKGSGREGKKKKEEGSNHSVVHCIAMATPCIIVCITAFRLYTWQGAYSVRESKAKLPTSRLDAGNWTCQILLIPLYRILSCWYNCFGSRNTL